MKESSSVKALRTRTGRAVTWIGSRKLADISRWALAAAVFAVPTVRNWNLLTDTKWLAWWVLGYFALEAWNVWLRGTIAKHASRRYERINHTLAGSIDTLGQHLLNSEEKQLNESQSRHLATAILHRIKDFTEEALPQDDELRIRVTLAVPLREGSREPRSIRVWCYDEPYADRGYTNLPVRAADGRPIPGSPEAFISGRVRVIDDVHLLTEIPDADRRPYRCVASIPVRAGGSNGQTLAVLNLDANRPNLFTEDILERSIMPRVAPAVNLVALVLLLRRKGERYEFGL